LRDGAVATLARLETLIAKRAADRQRQQILRREFVASAAKLEAAGKVTHTTNYNSLVVAHNAISGRMTVLGAKIEDSTETAGELRAALTEYLRVLADFSDTFEERRSEYRKEQANDNNDMFFASMGQALASLQRDIRSYNLPCENRHGHLILTVRLNNSVNARLMLDTGATFVSLSENVARRLGLDLSTKRIIKLRLADGSVADGTAIMLDSVRVGDAYVRDVRAVVMTTSPSDNHDGLLGMSFLRGFYIHFDPAAGKLTLKTFSPS